MIQFLIIIDWSQITIIDNDKHLIGKTYFQKQL